MGTGKCSGLGLVAYVLTAVGALNWGLVGVGGFMGRDLNVVQMLLGSWPQVLWVVYILVGLSAIYGFFACKDMCSTK